MPGPPRRGESEDEEEEDVPMYPLELDIADWSGLDAYARSSMVGNALEQKGFCFIEGFADEQIRMYAEKEAKVLCREDAMMRTPKEVLSTQLGPRMSCWTRPLPASDKAVPEREEYLCQIRACLEDVGSAFCGGFGWLDHEIIGHTTGVVHHTERNGDGEAPGLVSMDEALAVMEQAAHPKITLVYTIGSSAMYFAIAPREDLKKVHCVVTRKPVVLVFRTDMCCFQLDPAASGVAVQVDFVLRQYSGRLKRHDRALPVPKELVSWYHEHMKAVADLDGPAQDIPLDYRREAALSFHKGAPVRIVQLWHELPSRPMHGGFVTPSEASFLGGQDPVTEICRPRELDKYGVKQQSMYSWGGKWDPDEYYDPDPAHSVDFKMYTRHMAVINRNHAFDVDLDFKEFNLYADEDEPLDHRARMLLESTSGCLKSAGMELNAFRSQDVGFFVGLTSDMQFWSTQREARLSKYSLTSSRSAAIVNRLSYYFRTTGPAMCIDTEESSGTVALDAAISQLRQDRCGPLSVASSCHWIADPLETMVQCASGVLSRSGRTRVWDQGADGFTKGEGVVTLLLERTAGVPDGEAGDARELAGGCRVLLLGMGLNTKGVSSSLTAPNGAALADVMRRAAADAAKPMCMYDAIEASASGSAADDLVEHAALLQVLGDSGQHVGQPLVVRSAKAIYGSLGPVCGLVSIARSCALMAFALHGPALHLRQLQESMDELGGEGQQQRVLMPTEVIEANTWAQLVGVSSFGMTGTNCHGVLWGKINDDPELERRSGRPVRWWPVGEPQEADPPKSGYFIVGTWSAWQNPIEMTKEEVGVYGYTLTMGENNWESFQIWVDGDPLQALYPEEVQGTSDSSASGPGRADRENAWTVNGHEDKVRFVNEEQFAKYQANAASDDDVPTDIPLVLRYEGNYVPSGCEVDAGASEAEALAAMPSFDLNLRFAGQPGDRYHIRLLVSNGHKRVEWTRLRHPVQDEAAEPQYVHKYHIIGDHSYWSFQEMARSETEEGLYCIEVQLLRETSSFQIYRDEDWEQGFYPSASSSDATAEVEGPNANGHGKNWQIAGAVGDVFRVEFRRARAEGRDARSLRWEFVRSEDIDLVERAKTHKYHYVSSASGFVAMQEMQRSEDGTCFTHEIVLPRSGIEQFQILLNGNYMAAVHPTVSDASWHDGILVEGPDEEGADRYWAIGLHPKDQFGPGARVLIRLDLEGGLPKRVHWDRPDSENRERRYLAWGARWIFDQHCKAYGLKCKDDIGSDKALLMGPELAREREILRPNFHPSLLCLDSY